MVAITRRTLLLSSAAAGVLGAVAVGASGWSFVATGPEDVVVRIVRDRFPDMRIAEEDLRAFARDFLTYDRTSREKLTALRVALPIMQWDAVSGIVPDRAQDLYRGFERRIVTKFTLSTDFFQREPNDDRPLQYLGFADPYLLGCANPLAQFELETA